MLTLAPGCACDVCAEEYGPHRMPHSIPCGHVLCASCCTNIIEKTSPRLTPVCPFCRETFTSDSLRLIRMDFTTSGWSTPRRFPAVETFNDFNTEMLQRKTERLFNSDSKTHFEVRRMEDKVARIAAKKCSVEEVSSLYKELEEWLLVQKDEQTSSLFLSAALLRAILMNHLAHSEASKSAKTAETNLKIKIDELENNNAKFESELRRYGLSDSVKVSFSDVRLLTCDTMIRQRTQYSQKSQECQQLRQEVSQLRALATTLGVSAPELQPQRSLSPTPSSTSPTPYSSIGSSTASAAAAAASPLSRYNTMHSRSASVSSPTRSHTPAPRSHTPAPRSHTPGPGSSSILARSHTPGPGSMSTSVSASSVLPPRSHTPAHPVPSLSASAYARSQTPSLRSYTPAPPSAVVPPVPRLSTPAPPSMTMRTQTPVPLVPPKPRRLSQPSPPKMYRSTSEEKADAHERWIPPNSPEEHDYHNKYKNSTPRPPSRNGFSLSSRLRDVLS